MATAYPRSHPAGGGNVVQLVARGIDQRQLAALLHRRGEIELGLARRFLAVGVPIGIGHLGLADRHALADEQAGGDHAEAVGRGFVPIAEGGVKPGRPTKGRAAVVFHLVGQAQRAPCGCLVEIGAEQAADLSVLQVGPEAVEEGDIEAKFIARIDPQVIGIAGIQRHGPFKGVVALVVGHRPTSILLRVVRVLAGLDDMLVHVNADGQNLAVAAFGHFFSLAEDKVGHVDFQGIQARVGSGIGHAEGDVQGVGRVHDTQFAGHVPPSRPRALAGPCAWET